MKQSFKEFMSEKKLVDRWMILMSMLVGIFAGAVLMFLFIMLGLV